ncbi:MAG: DUF1153 domain-containing protein [Alphaproteobacteria bacterium]|nr:DUF1153 domain-containing protein [Alphaproteobacteria bacterium]
MNNAEIDFMSESRGKTDAIGSEDPPMPIEGLQPPDIKRWVVRRKASVVYAVETVLISLEDACSRCGIWIEKYESSRRLFEKHGMGELRVTRLNEYRDKPQEEASWEKFLFLQSSSKEAGGNNGDKKAQKKSAPPAHRI